ncbi:MAG TPA: tRNA epoxyqueuosine(34) reductase QueG [Nitrospira sp.]|nr:tRNA epoxyqueuosine(34) reductase QueG [Nitrospira sp.]
MSLSAVIRQEATALGFDAVGISSVAQSNSATLLNRLEEWLARRYHGTMAWLARDPSRRADPTVVLPNCRSIVSVGLNYDTGHRATEGPGFGRIARYAWGRDYHRTLGDRLTRLESRIKALAPTADTRVYVDTGPVMEKAWAQQAGLGWIGKHSNLVSAQHGSWLLLGEVLTTLELTPDEPATDLCGSCRLCIQACPTGAIVEPYVVDAQRCISYLTIEFRGPGGMIANETRQQMGNHIFGCDDCLDVCPFNLQTEGTVDAAFSPAPISLAPRLSELAELTEATFMERFRDSPIRRAKRDGLLRNVAIAQENEARHTKKSPLLSSTE